MINFKMTRDEAINEMEQDFLWMRKRMKELDIKYRGQLDDKKVGFYKVLGVHRYTTPNENAVVILPYKCRFLNKAQDTLDYFVYYELNIDGNIWVLIPRHSPTFPDALTHPDAILFSNHCVQKIKEHGYKSLEEIMVDFVESQRTIPFDMPYDYGYDCATFAFPFGSGYGISVFHDWGWLVKTFISQEDDKTGRLKILSSLAINWGKGKTTCNSESVMRMFLEYILK